MSNKEQRWSELSRQEKLASVLFPHLTPQERQAEMSEIARGEKKKGPHQQSLLKDSERGAISPLGNVARGWLKGKDQRR